MIEQLHYTWSVQGLQGRGRFQVTSASPGLHDLSSDQARLALRLCQWVAGRDQTAVSYGWIDARGSRLVFRRAPAKPTADNRPGNFAAHILVAPAGALGPTDLLRPAQPNLWWDGRPDDGLVLPTLTPQATCTPYPAVEESETVAVLAQLLDSGWTGPTIGSWSAVLDAAVRCVSVLPGALDQLGSFSTFEEGDSLRWFAVAGTQGDPSSARRPSLAAIATATMFTSGTERARSSLLAAARATDVGGAPVWADLTALAAALHAAHGSAPLDLSALTTPLARPSTAHDLLEDATVRSAVVAAVLRGEGAVLSTLATGAVGVSVQLLELFGQDMADRCLDVQDDASELAARLRVAVRHVSRLPGAVFNGLALRSVQVTGAQDCGDWPADLIFEALTLARLGSNAESELVTTASRSPQLPQLVTELRFPLGRRVHLATAGHARLAPEMVALLIRDEPVMAAALIPLLVTTGRLEATLDALDPQDAVRALVSVARSVPTSDFLNALAPLLPRMSVTLALQALRTAHRAVGEPCAELDLLHDHVTRRLVREQTEQVRDRLEITTLDRGCSESSEGVAWHAYLQTVKRFTVQMDDDTSGLLRQALMQLPREAFPAARALAVQAAAQALDPRTQPLRTCRDLEWILQVGADDDPQAGMVSLVRAAQRQVNRRGSAGLALGLIVLLARRQHVEAAVVEALGTLTPQLGDSVWDVGEAALAHDGPKVIARLRAMRDGHPNSHDTSRLTRWFPLRHT